jgi:hypothetical protein
VAFDVVDDGTPLSFSDSVLDRRSAISLSLVYADDNPGPGAA